MMSRKVVRKWFKSVSLDGITQKDSGRFIVLTETEIITATPNNP
jgi:hypothetical protein